MNLLFLCGGRRVKLIQQFRKALDGIGGGRIVTTDTEAYSATSFVADSTYQVPYCSDIQKFVESVARICNKEGIDVVVPLTCAAVATVPTLRNHLSAKVISGDDSCIHLCHDKLQSHQHFLASSVTTPDIIDAPTSSDLPVVFRPRKSEGSKGMMVVRTSSDLEFVLGRQHGIFNRFVSGDEYTADCYKDLSGHLHGVVLRKRLRVRAGEVEKSRVCRSPLLESGCRRILDPLNFVGPATVQAIYANDAFHFTEINLRYGGGVTLSIVAGMDSPKWLLAELLGQTVPPLINVCWGLGMSRYDEEFYFSDAEESS